MCSYMGSRSQEQASRSSESFFDVYDRDEMKLIYSIKNSILKEMFII